MADFRKLFLVLAVIAVTAASAFGQVNCAVGTSGVPQLRGGGITEATGDVLLICSQPAGAPSSTVNFTVLVSQPVTNRIGTAVPGKGYPTSAHLTVEAMTAAGIPDQAARLNETQGFVSLGTPTDTPQNRNVVQFQGVVLPAASQTFAIRIANIRVSVPVVTATQVPTSVVDTVSAAPIGAITLTNIQPIVGLVLPGLSFAVTDCAGGAAPALSFRQCNSFPTDPKALTFGVRFSESSIATAFKVLTAPTGTNNGEFTGRTYADGWDDTPDNHASAGTDHATRLVLTLKDVPDGVDIFVTNREIAGSSASTATSTASFVGTLAGDESTATCNGATTTVKDNDGGDVLLVQASKVDNTVTATWEITGSSQNADSLLFGVQVRYTANPADNKPAITGATPATLFGNFAPSFPLDNVAAQGGNASSPIPRFVTADIKADQTLAIIPCVTNLLFPYVTSLQGYDTGIALVNTSKDNGTGEDNPLPFNTSSQTGTCTLYYFGNQDVAPVTTDPVGPGSLVKFTLLHQLTGAASTEGFEGYVIAQCNFQYAHGFAFIVDTALPGFGSEAYLALVIPDRGGDRPPVAFTGDPGGEQLIH